MKASALILFLISLLLGCAAPPPALPTVPPTIRPLALAQTTNAPTATRDPNATAPGATLAPSRTNSAIPSTQTPAPTQTALRQAPTILSQFKLLDLPGEGRAPTSVALLNGQAYVANRESNNIAVLASERVEKFIPANQGVSVLVADASRNRIFAASYVTPTLLRIENDRVAQSVAIAGRVNALAVDENILYTALDNDALLERYDANTLTKKGELKLSQGFGVSALALDPARNRLYAALYGKIVAVDLNAFRELFTLDVPYLYSDFAVNPKDGSIWGAAYDDASSRAYIIGYSADGAELARLYIGSDLRAETFDKADRLYVLDSYNNQVLVIQTPQAQLVATIPVNESPAAAAFDSARQLLLVANRDSDNVSAIDTTALRVVSTIPLANSITALASNPTRKRVYAANASSNSVFVIEGTRVLTEIPTGNHPVDLAVDATANRLYVANRADGTLTVIDENTLGITASQFITRFLATVAVDSRNQKLFAGSASLNPASLKIENTVYAQGLTLNSQTIPIFERANAALKKLYAVASNGVPGSNSRVTLYRFLYDALGESKLLGSRIGGNTTAFDIDLSTNNVFAASTHPLAHTHALDVFDAQDNLLQTLALASHTTSLVVNPNTHHLFLAHAATYEPYAQAPRARDDTIEILDTRTLGRVAELAVPNQPWRMTLLGDEIYVAGYQDGMITILGDAVTNPPPSPTPTLTPTPYPTWTFTPAPSATPSAANSPTVSANTARCEISVAEELRDKIADAARLALGCPRATAMSFDQFAYQPLERGWMFDDFRNADAKRVTVLFPNKTYRVYPETWQEGDAEQLCPDAQVRGGLWRPKRGFASVWCSQPEVQALGAGLVEEHSTRVTQQPFEQGTVWFAPELGAFVLYQDGTWQ